MDVMGVVNIFTALQMNQTQNTVQTSVLRMAMDSQTQTSENIVEELNAVSASPAHLGNNIDMYF